MRASTPDSSTLKTNNRVSFILAHDVSVLGFGTFGTTILGHSVAVHNTKRVWARIRLIQGWSSRRLQSVALSWLRQARRRLVGDRETRSCVFSIGVLHGIECARVVSHATPRAQAALRPPPRALSMRGIPPQARLTKQQARAQALFLATTNNETPIHQLTPIRQ